MPAAFAANNEPSDAIIEFIKEREGYREYAYFDAGEYYIGYGTGCEYGEYPNGVSEAEADRLLRNALNKFANEVDSFADKYGISLTQSRFDALLSFTYNVGSGWMRGNNRLATYFKNGIENYSDVEIVDAMGVWSHQGGKVLAGLIKRRIAEAKIFLYGDYTGSNSPDYCYLAVDRNGGELENDIFCYLKGESYGVLPSPVLKGRSFIGWARSDGSILSEADSVTKNLSVKALWGDADASVVKLSSKSGGFKDVKEDDPYYAAISYCAEKDLMNGVGNEMFDPSGTLSRAMLVTVIWRLAGSPASSFEMTFRDVEAGQWYTEAVRWAAENGVVNGYSAEQFAPNDNITREQLAAVLYRFAATDGVRDGEIAETSVSDVFSDAADISPYAESAAVWAGFTGVLEVFGRRIMPKDDATRAQTALALMAYCEMR
ncbi:MAG: S-layer homology domain-containing protein [Oscillospiraceae bacterium]|nr:S-layer homology domain-containing protein [Oscillospiraceae bacterium]